MNVNGNSESLCTVFNCLLNNKVISAQGLTALSSDSDTITTNYDFINIEPFRLNFSATDTTKTANLPVEFIDDELPEKQESLLVYIKEYDGIEQARESKVVYVIDDDIDGKLSIVCYTSNLPYVICFIEI